MAVALNTFKTAIKAGEAQIGLWQALASPLTAEISAGAGFDWLLFDGEHGPNEVPLLLAQLQAAAPFPVHCVARPPIGETRIIKQYLDIGFTTLLIPLVETAEQAAQLVRACRYPPDGVRGVGAGIVRASNFNRNTDYLDRADEQICLLVQVETMLGLENLAAIAQTPGVDGVFIGPADLSAAMGFRGKPTHPQVQAEIERAFGVIHAAGKATGILMSDPTLAKRYLELGVRFIAVGTDVGLLVSATGALARSYKTPQAAPVSSSGQVY